jgi:hypothetical protein
MSTPQTAIDASTLVNAYDEEVERHSHEYDSGLVVMPVASRTAAHRIVRTHGGMSMRRVEFRTARTGRPPVIPRAVNGTNDTLLHATAAPLRPVPSGAGGNLRFMVSGEYLFVASDPRVPGVNSLPTGAYPHPLPHVESVAKATFRNFQPGDVTTVAEYDAAVSAAIAVAEANIGRLTYSWPLSVYPAAFSLPTIEG